MESTQCVFFVELTCSKTKTTVHQTITLDAYPSSAAQIKDEIQRECSVPVFTQTLWYESAVLKDTDVPSSLHMRSGDSLQVTFESTAECDKLEQVLGWLASITQSFEAHVPSKADTEPSSAAVALTQGISEGMLRKLSRDVFRPYESDVKQMNKRFLIHNGGLEILSRLFALILNQKWDLSPMILKHLERDCLQALYHIASTFENRELLIRHGCLEVCMRSLLRVRRDQLVELHPVYVAEDAMLVDLQACAMGTLCNLCEVTEAHSKIAENQEVLERYLWAAHSKVFEPWFSQLAVSVFVCLAQSPQTHPFVSPVDIVERLMDTCRIRSEQPQSDESDVLLLEYFVGLFLTHLILISPHLLPTSLYQRSEEHLRRFLSSATPKQIAIKEYQTSCFWAVLLPYVKLVYAHTPSIASSEALSGPGLPSLQLLATEFAVFFLHCILSNKQLCYIDTLLREKLVDYIICLPAHMPNQQLRNKAQDLVQELGLSVQIQPPSLTTLAKAKLAKMQFGLEKVIGIHSVQQLFS